MIAVGLEVGPVITLHRLLNESSASQPDVCTVLHSLPLTSPAGPPSFSVSFQHPCTSSCCSARVWPRETGCCREEAIGCRVPESCGLILAPPFTSYGALDIA